MEAPQMNSPQMHSANNALNNALTGCVSKLSVIEPQAHTYLDALKDYAHRYAQAQAYLVDDVFFIDGKEHDYSLFDDASCDLDQALLDDSGEPAKTLSISDDDIDSCGYMGWLRH